MKNKKYLKSLIKKESNFIQKILCKLHIHFGGICRYGVFGCSYCGEVLDIYNKEYFEEVLKKENLQKQKQLST